MKLYRGLKGRYGSQRAAPSRGDPGVSTATATPSARVLFCTTTGEPYQPVRLYYQLRGEDAHLEEFFPLRCMSRDLTQGQRCWVWLYRDEALTLAFERPYDELPPNIHPIVLGRFRQLEGGIATLEVRSVSRALQAARFFRPHFGSRAELRRVRVVNRFFEASESPGVGSFGGVLDRDVTVVDVQEEIAKLVELAAPRGGCISPLQRAQRLMTHLEGREFPAVEDFAVAREDVKEDFRQLASGLQLRWLVAHEHWKGNRVTPVQMMVRRLGIPYDV